ncbi:MAG TPA: hypothetical protein VFE62_13130 [Gemmataceae bacterium]|nr:hypothetical protein [Gemmataceae bacterium]
MRDTILRFFEATNEGFLYRIYVTRIDILCVRMGRSQIPQPIGSTVGIAGAAGAQAAYEEKMGRFEREVEEEGQTLAKRGEDGVRTYIRANDRGYEFDSEELDEVRLDYAGKWKRLFFMSPTPALFLRDGKDKFIFLLPKKKDVVIALHELELLCGDNLEINLRMDDYKKPLKKYAKMRDS